MGLAFATEALVLAILHWCELVIQESFASSLLCSFFVYAFLLQTLLHLVITGVWPDEREARRAYFAAVLAVCLLTAGCVVDTLPMPTVGPVRFSLAAACPDASVARVYQVLFFAGNPYYLALAGILLGGALVQFLIGAAGMYDHERRTGWPGAGWGNALAALLCARLAVLFDGASLELSSAGVFYLQLFTLPLVPLSIVWLLLMMIFILFICIDGIALSVLAWRVTRGVNMGLHAGFGALCCTVLGERGMLTPQYVASCSVCLAVSGAGFVWACVHPVRKGGEYIPLAPPTAPPAQARPTPRYYVPTHVVTGIDKKGT